MSIEIISVGSVGLEFINTQVNVAFKKSDLSVFEIKGFPSKNEKESSERIKKAIISSKINFPEKKVVADVNLKGFLKEYSFYDFPIAVGIFSLILKFEIPPGSIFFGKLSPDGFLEHTKGTFLLALFAKENGYENIFIPYESANEVSSIKGINIYPVKNLKDALLFLSGKKKVKKEKQKEEVFSEKPEEIDFIEDKKMRRILEISAAGEHNVLIIEDDELEKRKIALFLLNILPKLNKRELLEINKIYSASGNIAPEENLLKKRPLRALCGKSSSLNFFGGREGLKIGEISLAHRGVLLLHNADEVKKSILERFKKPLKDGYVVIEKKKGSVVYPSKIILFSFAKGCSCGKINEKGKKCRCSKEARKKHKKRVIESLSKSVDMQPQEVQEEKEGFFSKKDENKEKIEKIREKVKKARDWQKKRFKEENIFTNSEMRDKDVEKYSFLQKEAKEFLKEKINEFSTPSCSYFKIIKIARTIADFQGDVAVEKKHIVEAMQYRARKEL